MFGQTLSGTGILEFSGWVSSRSGGFNINAEAFVVNCHESCATDEHCGSEGWDTGECFSFVNCARDEHLCNEVGDNSILFLAGITAELLGESAGDLLVDIALEAIEQGTATSSSSTTGDTALPEQPQATCSDVANSPLASVFQISR